MGVVNPTEAYEIGNGKTTFTNAELNDLRDYIKDLTVSRDIAQAKADFWADAAKQVKTDLDSVTILAEKEHLKWEAVVQLKDEQIAELTKLVESLSSQNRSLKTKLSLSNTLNAILGIALIAVAAL